MVYDTHRAYEGGCQSSRRQGETRNRRHYKEGNNNTCSWRPRRRMERRGAWSRQPYTAFSSSDPLQNGYNGTSRSPSKPRPYSQQARKPTYHVDESKVDHPSYQNEESSPLDALLNGSLEHHEEQHGYGLQGLVKKFAHDNNRPSRQMLMLQQQIYQEGQAPLNDLDTQSTQFYSQFTKCQTTSYYGNGNPWQQQHRDHYRNGYTDIGDHYKAYEDKELDHPGQYSMDHPGYHGRVNEVDGQYGRTDGRGQLTRNEYTGQHGRYLYRNPDTSYSYNGYNSSQNPSVSYHQGNNYSNHNNHHGNGYHGNNYHNTKVFYPSRPSSVSPTMTMYSTDGTTGSISPSLPDSEIADEQAGMVEVVVSNLDYNISPREWKNILISQMKDHIKMLWIDVFLQPDNTSLGFLKVATIQEARHAIAMFHRKKLGYKRINLSLKNEDAFRAETTLRSETAALLSEAKGNVLPLFKFIELFNKKYKHPVSVAELYKMRDTIEIREQGGSGRMIHLIPTQRRMMTGQGKAVDTAPGFEPELGPGPGPARVSPGLEDLEVQQIVESLVCVIHCPPGSVYYLEAINTSMLPNVKLQLKTFSAQVHSLLMLHDGDLPLMSFPVCYRSEVMPLPCVYEGGVPLEHLISCVPGVQIVLSNKGVKKVSWAENKAMTGSELMRPCPSTLLNQQLSQLSREMVELLKSSPGCRLTFTHFHPAYHHHFGHQCRVADYGYSGLLDLFEAIPQVVQVLGAREKRMVTLTHKTQIRRFTTDLLRLLKMSPGKQLYQSMLKDEFDKMFNTTSWDIKDYGVCCIEDMLGEIPAGTILMTSEGQDTIISVPRKDQTSEELERTKQFCLEVVDLLKHNQQCRMMFNKFIPAYHHHFGRQCRVSDYGFTKLLDLFEAIPHIIEIEDEGEEKVIRLTESELRKVVGEQIVSLLRQKKVQCFPLDTLGVSFTLHYGYSIPLQDFSVNTVEELMSKLKHVIKVEIYDGYPYIILADRSSAPPLARQVLQLLMDQSGGSLPLMELCSRYKTTFGIDPDIQKIKEELLDYVQISGDDKSGVISLTPLQMLARDIRVLLQAYRKVVLGQFERLFYEKFGVEMKPALYGFPSTVSLLMAIPHVVCMKGKGQRRVVHLSGDLQSSLPIIDETCGRQDDDSAANESSSALTDDESPMGVEKMSPLQRLANSSPTGSSPNLMPSLFSSCRDQITCNFSPDTDTDALFALNDEERKKQKSPLCHTPTSQLLQHTAANSTDCYDGHVMHSYKAADESQSPDIIDHILKYGWWRQSPESDEHDRSSEHVQVQAAEHKASAISQFSGSNNSIHEHKLGQGHDNRTSPKSNSPYNNDKTNEDSTVSMSEDAARNGLYATVAYLRKESEQRKDESEQNSRYFVKHKVMRKSEEEIEAGNTGDEEMSSQAPVALCPRPLQPGSYWFSKQFQSSSSQDELPSTSKQEVRKMLASLSGKQVKKPGSARCSETEFNEIENVNVLNENANTTGPFSISSFSGVMTPSISNAEEHAEQKHIDEEHTEEETLSDVNLSDAEKAWLNHEGDDACPCYETVFSPDQKLETSSVLSDGSVTEDRLPTKSSPLLQRWLSSNSSYLSDESQNNSLLSRSGQRRCRIAAKFEQPLE